MTASRIVVKKNKSLRRIYSDEDGNLNVLKAIFSDQYDKYFIFPFHN